MSYATGLSGEYLLAKFHLRNSIIEIMQIIMTLGVTILVLFHSHYSVFRFRILPLKGQSPRRRCCDLCFGTLIGHHNGRSVPLVINIQRKQRPWKTIVQMFSNGKWFMHVTWTVRLKITNKRLERFRPTKSHPYECLYFDRSTFQRATIFLQGPLNSHLSC